MYGKKQYYNLWTELRAAGVVVLLMVGKSVSDYSLGEVVLSEPLASLNQEFASMRNIVVHYFFFLFKYSVPHAILTLCYPRFSQIVSIILYLEFCTAKASFNLTCYRYNAGVISNRVMLRYAPTRMSLPFLLKMKTNPLQTN